MSIRLSAGNQSGTFRPIGPYQYNNKAVRPAQANQSLLTVPFAGILTRKHGAIKGDLASIKVNSMFAFI
jgi:hypothetical protein